MGKGARGGPRGRSSKETATNGDRGDVDTRAYIPSTSNRFPREWRGKANNQPHFSLEQAAQNTDRHRSWNSDLKLRHANVAFVKIGQSTIDEVVNPIPETQRESVELLTRSFTPAEIRNDTLMAQLKPQDFLPQEIHDEIFCETIESNDYLPAIQKNELAKNISEMETENKIFFVDVNGTKQPIHTGLPQPMTRRSQSPEMSDSSEEVIVFSGRARVLGDMESKGTVYQNVNSSLHQFKGPTDRRATSKDDPMVPKTRSMSYLSPQLIYQEPVSHDFHALKPNAHSKSTMSCVSRKKAHEDEILADYIANVDASENPTNKISDAPDTEPHVGGLNSQIEGLVLEAANSDFSQHDGVDWDLSNLKDLPNLDSLSEDSPNLARDLTKSERCSGVQYLFNAEGCSADDARWEPLSSLKKPCAERHIGTPESKHFEAEQYLTDSDESDDHIRDRQAAMDIQQELDDLLHEQDLLNRKKEIMTDENIARLLSKQEELGFGSGDLLLFDGQEHGEEDQAASSRKVTHNYALRSRDKKKNQTLKNAQSTSPYTKILGGDPYDGFDLMDQEHPSLRKRHKGRRGAVALKLTGTDVDTDVDDSMQLAWENDRAKKKIRKQEREERRTQGLLGKKNRTDLKTKYTEGMSIAEINYEIKGFLLSSAESLALPPMERGARKTVHEIANVFKLKSNSVGGGKSRFPVLHKTSRTAHYDGDAQIALEAQMSGRRFLPRRDKGLSKGYPTIRKARGGGFSKAAVSYQDGEVVGAAAPELGQENKGRAMLERMGWSTGTALGAINNKGIMQPVAHVVKTTKAGLG